MVIIKDRNDIIIIHYQTQHECIQNHYQLEK